MILCIFKSSCISSARPIRPFSTLSSKRSLETWLVIISSGVLFYIHKLITDEEIAKLIKAKGWKKTDDNYVFVANHEESIKTKNIVEKIKFDGEF